MGEDREESTVRGGGATTWVPAWLEDNSLSMFKAIRTIRAGAMASKFEGLRNSYKAPSSGLHQIFVAKS